MQEIKKVTVKQEWLDLINQVFEIEKKLTNIKEDNSIQRNINRINNLFIDGFFTESGFIYHNPLGEDYAETRNDCIATIQGESKENLEIIEVNKPIIYFSYKENINTLKNIVQQAVVIVQSKNINQ